MSKIINLSTHGTICIQVNILKDTSSYFDKNITIGPIKDFHCNSQKFTIISIVECNCHRNEDTHYEINFKNEDFESLLLRIPIDSPWVQEVNSREFEIIETVWTFNVPGDSHIRKPMDLLNVYYWED